MNLQRTLLFVFFWWINTEDIFSSKKNQEMVWYIGNFCASVKVALFINTKIIYCTFRIVSEQCTTLCIEQCNALCIEQCNVLCIEQCNALCIEQCNVLCIEQCNAQYIDTRYRNVLHAMNWKEYWLLKTNGSKAIDRGETE